LIDNV